MEVLAVTCSDVHLTLTAPISRSNEPDWLEAQGRVLDQVKEIADKHQVPVIYAGDIFHKNNAPPELINWAIGRLPWGYAVPGQHDLPHHVYDDVRKSAYWTLVEVGNIVDLEWNEVQVEEHSDYKLALYGFPWGKDIRYIDHDIPTGADLYNVAVIHKYIWVAGKTFVGAPEEEKLSAYKKELRGFDVATFGDNHKGFTGVADDCKVINNGCLIPRRADELNYEPFVGLICLDEDGYVCVSTEKLDISQDLWSLDESMSADAELIKEDMGRFLKELKSLNSDEYNFKDAVTHFLATNKVSEGVKGILLDVLED